MRMVRSAQELEAQLRRDCDWLREQVELLRIHLEGKTRASLKRTIQALRAIENGTDWRHGRSP